MGDAQFGLHGATAIGWMTLEGTKKAGTDLHSKMASHLGISCHSAEVFNYSRIYGAGMKHAMVLLLQSNTSMLPEQAQRLAEQLYASTKRRNTHRTSVCLDANSGLVVPKVLSLTNSKKLPFPIGPILQHLVAE